MTKTSHVGAVRACMISIALATPLRDASCTITDLGTQEARTHTAGALTTMGR